MVSLVGEKIQAMATKLVSFAAVFWDVTQRSHQRNVFSFLWGERCVTSQKTAAKETTTKQDLGLAFRGSFQNFRRALPYMAVPSGSDSFYDPSCARHLFVNQLSSIFEILISTIHTQLTLEAAPLTTVTR